MKPLNKAKRRRSYKHIQSVYGQEHQYWPDEMLPFILAAACAEVVLKSSEEANSIYRDAVEVWGRPGCQEALSGVKVPIKNVFAYLNDDENGLRLAEELDELYERYKDNPDCAYLINRINEFIKVGFNREKDKANGKYKVLSSKSPWLGFAVGFMALVDFSSERPDWETYKLVEFNGKTYDITTLLGVESDNRKYRRLVKFCKSQGWKLRQDQRLRDMAWYWYNCRVVYSGPAEFCRKYLLEKGIELDPANISKEIMLCDIATGYPRKNISDQIIS